MVELINGGFSSDALSEYLDSIAKFMNSVEWNGCDSIKTARWPFHEL